MLQLSARCGCRDRLAHVLDSLVAYGNEQTSISTVSLGLSSNLSSSLADTARRLAVQNAEAISSLYTSASLTAATQCL